MTGFDGKVATVTGGGSGLGEAIGKALGGRGVKVLLSDIKLEGGARAAAEIRRAGGMAAAVEHDTAKAQDSERVVSHALSTYGALHYAVNDACIGGKQAPAGETELADWRVHGCVIGCPRRAAPPVPHRPWCAAVAYEPPSRFVEGGTIFFMRK